ncbi:uncharacterized protein LOC115194769 [Salmo trutta]|uniref:uncharacterized protein LOC115194769 n=1 Tax=Salmo trutta TaxID=8032 RepID=UPI0011300BB1|nr:uncharacterized protein LOC115194769 [Salmo trutta]
MKTFPTSAVWCLGILFISVSLITTGSSEVQVVGSANTVVALIGDDVILPCFLKPNVSAEDMTVEWTGLYLKTRNIHLYLDSRDSNEDQHPSYRGRTSMFNEELKNGNVSLKLTRVTLSDAGSYRCFIPTLKSQVKETTVQLFVGAVSQPVISIDGTKGWGVVLKCESGGWFPEPEMEWLDSSGTILPADGPPERHRDSEGLYAVRRHVTVNQTDINRFTCRVNQLEINHMKETEINVPDDVFPKSQTGLIVGLIAAVAVAVLAASAGVYKRRKHTDEVYKKAIKRLKEHTKDFKLAQEKWRDAKFVDINKGHLIQNVTTVIPKAFYLIRSETYCKIHAAASKDQMSLLYEALEEAGLYVKSDFYRILLDLETDLVTDLGASFVDDHKYRLIQMVTKVKPIMYELFYEKLYCNIRINQMYRQEQMRLLFEALEEAEDTTRVKSDFYRILLDLEPELVFNLGGFNTFKEHCKRLEEQCHAQFVTSHKDHLIKKVSKGKSIASELHQKDLIPDEINSQISAAGTSQEQMRLLYEALEEAEDTTRVKSAFYGILLHLEFSVVKDLGRFKTLGDAQYVTRHKDHLIQMVSKGKSIASELHKKNLIPDEMNSQISAAGTSQDQMRLLFKALEEAEDSTRVKSAFYGILLDLEPDVVYHLDGLKEQLKDVTRERDELKEKLRKAEETIQSLSTSPDGQQKTQTPSQKSEGTEGMEMESLPGRKSGPGSVRKSAPEMKPLLGPGPQKDELDELERGGRV